MSNSEIQSVIFFTSELIDYAGLFPPAKLDLNTSIQNYLKYQSGSNSNMLSKFICPVKLLPELDKVCESLHENTAPIDISLILSGGEDIETFKSNFISDLEIRNNFINKNNLNFTAVNFEYKIPEIIFSNYNKEEFIELLKFISQNSINETGSELYFFAETTLNGDWKKNVKFTADALEFHNESYSDTGFKLRTGGVVKSAFPTSEQIAYSIGYCLKRGLQMKFTAGLHHPFRHFNKDLNTKMHGFINVFTAGIIAKRHNISEHEMIKLLEDESSENFKFTETGLKWGGYDLSNEDIHFARTTFVRSYGSCSFDEPVDDLKKLNLLN